MVKYCECAKEFLVSKCGEKWGLTHRAYGIYFHKGFRCMGLMDEKKDNRNVKNNLQSVFG